LIHLERSLYSVGLAKQYKHITWECTTVCNYSCSYCWPANHDGVNRWPDELQTQQLLSTIEQFRQHQPLSLDIMGGEPTLWPDFVDFCKQLGNNTSITFSTNASRSLRWWSMFDAPVDEIVISWHPEYTDNQHIMRVIELLHQQYRTVVHLMDHPLYTAQLNDFYQQLEHSNYQINCQVKKLQHPTQGTMISAAGTTQSFSRTTHKRADFLQTPWLVDNSEVDINEFYNQAHNQFQGWHCELGKDYLYIQADGEVFGAACRTGGSLGNIYDNYTYQPVAQTCPHVQCLCKADVQLIGKTRAIL